MKKHTLHREKCEISRNGIFSVHSAPFLAPKWDFTKIVKTSTKQLYNRPTNQKWQGLVKKRTLYCTKTEMSTDGHAHSNTPSAFCRGVNLDEKRALYCPKTEMSTDGGTEGRTDGGTDGRRDRRTCS